jgi:hypothetical protein
VTQDYPDISRIFELRPVFFFGSFLADLDVNEGFESSFLPEFIGLCRKFANGLSLDGFTNK